jgi:hypothetical protein
VIVLDLEGGCSRVQCKKITSDIWSWSDVVEACRIAVSDTDCQTIAVDTLDRVDLMTESEILRLDPKAKTINSAFGGYGAGFERQLKLLQEVDEILSRSGKTIVYLAHAGKVVDPSPGGERTVYGPNISKRANAYFLQECDEIYFASDKVTPEGVAEKVCYTRHSSWCVAKTRSGAPAEVPLTVEEVLARPSPELIAKARDAIKELEQSRQAPALKWLLGATKHEIKAKLGVQ